jgi:hypothetical protein
VHWPEDAEPERHCTSVMSSCATPGTVLIEVI